MQSVRDVVIGGEKPCQIFITKRGRDLDYINGETTLKTKGVSMVKRFTSKASGLVMPLNHFTGKNVWILKPTSFNRGKGIHVVSDLKKLKRLIKDYSSGRETSTIPIQTVLPIRNQSIAPPLSIINSTTYKLPWNYNPLPQKSPSVAQNNFVQIRQSVTLPNKHQSLIKDDKLIQKPKPNLLATKQHKVNLSSTQINALLIVKGQTMVLKS